MIRIESALDSLAKEKAIWERTRQRAEGADAPDRIVTRIRITLSEIDKAIATVSASRASLLTLQDRVIQQDLVASEAVGRIEAAQREDRSGIFEQDAPPLHADLRKMRPG